MDTTIENHNQSKYKVVEPSGYIYKKTSAPKAQGTLQKSGQRDFKSKRIREFAVRLGLLIKSEMRFLQSQQHKGPNMS